ncbi:unnamed protein product [Fraxinus pennsylvanica]|uniref:Uncharacterized protein n=1 Tax=Fraxinus pennsylvanica TaxID=56036 RepID=A0AAD2AFQ5_9LAMI|nr:unnamed protein product [Fraxinus pennsylvanica]
MDEIEAYGNGIYSSAAEMDETMGTGSGWERFNFDKDAPLDDEEIEAAEDDVALVKHAGQSFRFSVVKAKKEEDIRDAHDEAMFGASSLALHVETDNEAEEDNNTKENVTSSPVKSLLSDQVRDFMRDNRRRQLGISQ